MALFALQLQFNPDRTEDRLAIRPTHRQYLQALFESGKLVLSGPFTDDSGALIIYDAANQATAEALWSADPYAADASIFDSVSIKEWNPTFAREFKDR